MIIDRPRGVVPRAKGCGLGPEFAQIAENIRLLEGRFEPWRQPLRLLEFDQRILTAHVRDCCWTGTAVPNARYVDAGIPLKTYLSAPGERAVVTDSVCDSDWTYLGYPTPGDPVVLRDSSAECTADTQLRTYRITYGTDCEEGPASCPSNAITVSKGHNVRLQLPPAPEAMWGATHVNIYRSEALWDTETGLLGFNPNEIDGGWHSTATQQDYFLIARLPIQALEWVDNGDEKTGSLLTSEELIPPPDGLRVVGETEAGSLVGFVDCQLLFSERNKFWGFPFKTAHTFPHEIVDVVVCKNTVYVITKATPYVVTDDADCKESTARSVVPVKDSVPGVCGGSSLAVGDAALYIGAEGLVLLRPDGSYSIASRLTFGKDEWAALGPNRMHLGKGCDHLFLSVQGGPTLVWILSFDESGYLPEDVTSLSFTPIQWITGEDDTLYMLSDNTAFEFNVGDYLQMRWRQVEQRSTQGEVLSAIKGEYVKKKTVDFNTLSVYKGGTLSAVRKLTEKGSRIRGSATTCTQIELKGSEPMCWIAAGSGLNDLERRPT